MAGSNSPTFQQPFPVQPSVNRLAAWVLKLLGWRVLYQGLPARQGMLVVYPHTSNWDFVILVLAKWSIGIQLNFWGKDKLFRIPLFGAWLSWLGGVPVSRTSPRGVVGQAVDAFAQARAQDRYFWLALAPEGTRKYIPGWRSGFYQTAVQAKSPLGMVRLDYKRREITAQNFIYLSGDVPRDLANIAQVFDGVTGYNPGNAAPITLLDPAVPRAETVVK